MEELFIKDSSTTKRMIHQSLFATELLIDGGLFEGKLGKIILFYYYGKYAENQLYTELADTLVDDLLEKIEIGDEAGLKKGLSGIAWGILHLIEQKFLLANPSELLTDLDIIILQKTNTIEDQSMDNGLAGILFYINSRISYSMKTRNKTIFTDWYDTLISIADLRDITDSFLIEQMTILKHLRQNPKNIKMDNNYVFSKILFG